MQFIRRDDDLALRRDRAGFDLHEAHRERAAVRVLSIKSGEGVRRAERLAVTCGEVGIGRRAEHQIAGVALRLGHGNEEDRTQLNVWVVGEPLDEAPRDLTPDPAGFGVAALRSEGDDRDDRTGHRHRKRTRTAWRFPIWTSGSPLAGTLVSAVATAPSTPTPFWATRLRASLLLFP